MNPTRILVVDDNPTNLKLAVDVLKFEGYEVFRALNAKEAERVIKRSPPHLILMDIQMPGMDGLTFTRKLKGDAATREIPIVAMTSFAMKGDDQRAKDAGCDGYLTKPVDTRKLPGQVAEILSRPKLINTRRLPAEILEVAAGETQEQKRDSLSNPI